MRHDIFKAKMLLTLFIHLFLLIFCKTYILENPLSDSASFDETEYDTVAEIEFDREIFLNKPVIFLSDLARKDPRVLQRKSYLYLYNVLTVAVFYGLPVVQLVITYQKVKDILKQ